MTEREIPNFEDFNKFMEFDTVMNTMELYPWNKTKKEYDKEIKNNG